MTCTLSPPQAVSVYSDVAQGASLLITQANSSWSLRGVLGPGRSIAPRPDSLAPPAGPGTSFWDALAASPSLAVAEHVVTTGVGLAPDTDYQEVEDGGRSRGGRQGRAAMPATIQPEILVVVDEAFFNDMKRDVAATQSYIVSFFNAVNMRFGTVSSVSDPPLTALSSCTSPSLHLLTSLPLR